MIKYLQIRTDFTNSWKNITKLLPLLWPRNTHLRICFVLSWLILGCTTILDVYKPIYSKLVVDSMTSENKENLEFRWDLICVYFLLKFLGHIDELRYILWDEIIQNMKKEVKINIFSHIHKLSLRWHLKRKTGEVLQVLDRSADSINSLMDIGCFYFFRVIVDTCISIGAFSVIFDFWFGLTLLVCMTLHAVMTFFGNEWVLKFKKIKENAVDETQNRSIDSLLNFETVKYFGNERYEMNAFKRAMSSFHKSRLNSSLIDAALSSAQSCVIDVSLLIGSLLCVYRVVKTRDLTVGDYIMFSQYFTQLYGTVDAFEMIYKNSKDYMTDVDHMFEILREEQEVLDSPNAKELEISGGSIIFKNVFFEYLDNEPILKNISFTVPPGKTIALVGPTGSGKSTIVRLIFRFYDVKSGSIFIDGQNIKDVTQESLRKAIGIVPQDTVLFNETIRYNIRYGRISAEEKDIVEAAKGSDIHKQILNFTDGYDTKVGERGLRLSGGEKQRVAIARTLLKAAPIVVMDEATSSLDINTERNIQDTLKRVCSNRTTILIAHRLSTIIHADQILVLKDGVISERGRHEELLEKDGTYASMWKAQFVLNNGSNKKMD